LGISSTVRLHFQPGTRWKYSLSIDVIGHIVEIISGQSLDRFFEEQIFKPLGMIDIAFYVPREKVSRLTKVYGHVGDNPQLEHIPVVFTEALPHPPSHLIAGGGLFSTLPDYARFAQMLVNGGELDGVRLLSPTTVAMMEINQAPAEALPYGFADNDLYHAGYGYSNGARVQLSEQQHARPTQPGAAHRARLPRPQVQGQAGDHLAERRRRSAVYV
jgi:CubicO group peptidase (beta-lactamase class C family)